MAPGERDHQLRLRLYVNGASPRSAGLVPALRQICDENGLSYDLEVLDVTVHPEEAEADRVAITPTLLRTWPPPQLRIVGDLTDASAAMDGLGLRVWQRSAENAAIEPAELADPPAAE
jgi:circadian clock protein KaiB